ncbi:hypothetical protein JCM4814A_22740 [Streptomyces phaeofaciens JCM 4814]|uniref:Uncharacterized protein n=1 Tax=Streptomyces phaeofaciens TaxID=68254 RepID=A0A918H2Z2_9ACTN|nr:hypothetical protein [Streptomyces phaeofaciens]GGT34454.1 hypothetical protein GCM10010226_08090 [Streptomyces phaeofaciens]
MAGGEEGTRGSRARVRVGLPAVILGCYLVGDSVHRARAAIEFGARWWPWMLLGLAVVNLLRSALPAASLIGPLVLASIAVAGLVRSGHLGTGTVMDLALPGLLALCGAALLWGASGGELRSSWTRVLTSGRIAAPRPMGKTLVLRAVLGELRADLTATGEYERDTVHVTAFAGHIRMTVPRDRWVNVHASGTVLTRVVETGAPPAKVVDPSVGLTVHVLGVCAVVGIVRV